MQKAVEAIDKSCSIMVYPNTDLLMFQSQLYFEMGALKTTNITSSSESHIVNTLKEHEKKKQQKSEVENISESHVGRKQRSIIEGGRRIFHKFHSGPQQGIGGQTISHGVHGNAGRGLFLLGSIKVWT